ncbi:MAG: class I SAM-dependent methyltransferase [Nannocystaceae bacterium]|nr:class I SAM-dependent methyltransferase [Nannocystaceae bacterium]
MGFLSRKTEGESSRATPSARPALEPAMGLEEQSQLCAIYATRRPKTAVEFGSGGSTLLIPGAFDFIETYISVEHNEMWHKQVQEHSKDTRVKHLFEPPASHAPEPAMFKDGKGKTLPEYVAWSERCEREPEIMASYVAAPYALVQHPDLILVDGRARRYCIETAWEALKPGGVLVVHDSQREEYIKVIDEVCGDRAHWLVPFTRGQVCVAAKG